MYSIIVMRCPSDTVFFYVINPFKGKNVMKAVLNNIDSVLEKLANTDNLPKLPQQDLEKFLTRAMTQVGEEIIEIIKHMRQSHQHQPEFEVTLPFTDELVKYGQMLQDIQKRERSYLSEYTIAEIIDILVPAIRVFLNDAFGVTDIATYVKTKRGGVESAGISFYINWLNVEDRLRSYRQKLAVQVLQTETEARLEKALTYIEVNIPAVLTDLNGTISGMNHKLDATLTQMTATNATVSKADKAKSTKHKNPRDTPMSERKKSTN